VQVKIRLQRFGSKKRPFYRIITSASGAKRDGKFLDIVGLYHPISAEDKQVRLDVDKIKNWLSKGAQPTDTVKDIFAKNGFWKEFTAEKAARKAAVIKRKNVARKANKKGSAGKAAPQV